MRLPIHAVCFLLGTVLCLPSPQAQFLPPLLAQQRAQPPEISIAVPPNVDSDTVQGEYFLFGAVFGWNPQAQFLPPLLAQQRLQPPAISIAVPASVNSESLQGEHFLFGSFPMSFGYIIAKPNVSQYVIEAAVKGIPASGAKIVVYANGCQTRRFFVTVKEVATSRDFECKPLPSVALDGVIVPFESFSSRDIQIDVTYMASWVVDFFRVLRDAPITSFKVATAIPRSDGSFHVDLPDFTQDANEQAAGPSLKGEFNLILRERHTGYVLAFLRQKDTSPTGFLQLQASYPSVIRFEARQ